MNKIRENIKIKGIVQGVGFRPFIHRQVLKYGLTGWICNTSYGVEMEAEGSEEAISAFIKSLETEKPVLALIEEVKTERQQAPADYSGFEIRKSKSLAERKALISPDVCICHDCLAELFDKGNRRYHYPFINCTNCGPRFTIVKDVPYDRKSTTMAPFEMCPECAAEYADIADRRYHAQPDCCPECGPHLSFCGPDGNIIAAAGDDVVRKAAAAGSDAAGTGIFAAASDAAGDDAAVADIFAAASDAAGDDAAICLAQRYLSEGKIVAVKGLGGFHLACRMDDPEIALKLRRRKHRDEKPFAVMCRDVDTVRTFCEVSADEEKVLTSFRRPIVLLKKKPGAGLGHISENGCIGVMLPYTPLHYLLLDGPLPALVMTSANLSDLPIIYKNAEAFEKLSDIADGFLMHNREIETRCDDSLCYVLDGGEYFLRRSRGYVPYPITVQSECAGLPEILACGAEQKASFCLSKENHVFPSQHIGDLKNMETFENYEGQIRHFERLFDIRPAAVVCDLHPDYLSSAYAKERAKAENIPLISVQHHHAHMASCMADNGLSGDVIGIVWDGTGLGTDGTVWGAEFLTGGYGGFERRGTILPFGIPGGDRATKEIWRVGISLLREAGISKEGMRQFGAEGEPGGTGKTGTVAGCTEKAGTVAGCAGKAGAVAGCAGKAGTASEGAGFSEDQVSRVFMMLDNNINSPVCTSMGRLFDGAAAILGIKKTASYEGQGAVLLEAAGAYACENCSVPEGAAEPQPDFAAGTYPYDIIQKDGLYYFDYREMIRCMAADVETEPYLGAHAAAGAAAAKFMNTLVDMAASMCENIRKDTGLNRVVLSGGTFQNVYMTGRLIPKLQAAGFEAYRHSRVSANDEGISLGQLMAAAQRLKTGER